MEQPTVTGQTLIEAEFDDRYMPYTRWLVTLWLVVTVAGILVIPFWWLLSLGYCPEYMRRVSARLTTNALEIRKGVFMRAEATIPLNRITDVRLHDGPLMRHYNLRGLKVETAGQGAGPGASESNLIGVVDAVQFRDAILRQRQQVLGAEVTTAAPAQGSTPSDVTALPGADGGEGVAIGIPQTRGHQYADAAHATGGWESGTVARRGPLTSIIIAAPHLALDES